MTKAKFYFIVLFVLFLTKVSVSQYFRPFIENFTSKEYGDSLNSQNWSITQNNQGILFFGNDKRLLEFDGENWNTIRTSVFGGFVSSLYTDNDGTVYLGSYGEFGKIEIDSIGRNKYVSLSENLNDKDAFFSNVWKIYKYNDAVLFFSEEKIFLFQNNQITVINPKTSFHLSFVVDNQLFVRQREIGLMKYIDNEFRLVNNGEIFKDYGIFGIFPTQEEEEYLIVTQELGVYKFYDKEKYSKIIPINNSSKSQLISSNIFGGILLSDNKIALNTSHNGVVIINRNAEIEQVINSSLGIKDNDVKQVFQDSNDDLWLAMNTGICRVNYSSQVSSFNANSKITGDVATIVIFDNNLLAGTTEGLFEYDKKQQAFTKSKIFTRQIYQINTANNNLIVSSELGLFELIDINKGRKISDIRKAQFCYVESKDLLFVAGKNKIETYLYQNNKWNLKASLQDILLNDITRIICNNESDFWFGTLNTELWNITVSDDYQLSHAVYNYSDGINSGFITPFKTDSMLVFGNPYGLLKFTNGKALDKVDSVNNYKGYFESTNYLGLEKDAITILENDSSKIWLCKNGEISFFDKDKNKFETQNFTNIDIGKVNTFYPYNSNIFVGGNDGITYVNLGKQKDFDKKINVNIRRITLDGDSIIYYGNNTISTETQVLDYSKNSFVFNFAALYKENGNSAKYSYFMEGYDDSWSDWSFENIAKYKKIPAGNYVFKVKAKNLYGIESNIAEYSFSITPPFYLSIWAYILYTILLLIVLWGIIKLYTRKLIKDKERLEGIIQERTVEIREQKDKIVEIHTELTDSINYAQRIQQAVLPSDKYLDKILNDYFILFKPKDVVSGDFYWATKVDEYIIITAADCTGHGVPGAFMSMLGTSFLNEIVRNTKIIKANEILFELRKSVIDALNQQGKEGEQKDGMDMSLCTINTLTQEIQWSGANNPLYIISNRKIQGITEIKGLSEDNTNSFYELKPNKMPISIYLKMDKFDNNVIQLEAGDKLYMFSDGYADQFGGPKGKKFKYKPFKRLLLENANKPMSEQKEIISEAFETWKADSEQIDDVVVVGIKI